MAEKPTYEQLEKRLIELEKEAELRRQAEASLRESEGRYRALFESNPVETITVDRQGRVTEYNRARKYAERKLPKIGDVMYRDYASRHHIDMYDEMMECIRLSQTRRYPELKYKDEYLSISIASFHGGAIITSSDITLRKQSEQESRRLIEELRLALAKVKKLSGLIPICSSCKKIRDDSGYWNQIEAYIRDHSEAEFSHGVCPECARMLYPEVFENS